MATEACPVCNGEGHVYRMTAAYESMATQAAGGGSFGWTGPTHEWRTCRVCGGRGILPNEAEAVVAERARIAEAVRGLIIRDDFGEPPDGVLDHIDGWCGFRAAVLEIIAKP